MLELRDRMRRFAMATLIVSQGVPMILMGDENGRTQNGNNNAYCQDNELAWMDWSPEPREAAMLRLRRGGARGSAPSCRCSRRRTGCAAIRSREGGLPGVRWLRPDGVPMSEAEWKNGDVRALMVALAGADGSEALLLVSAAVDAVAFVLPATGLEAGVAAAARQRQREIDPETPPLAEGAAVSVAGRSLRLYSR